MKKIFFLLPVLFIAFFSCNNNKENGGPGDSETSKSVVGKWKIVEMNMEGMDEDQKADAERNSTIEIRKDGSYTSKDSEGTEEGTYKYDKEAGRLIVSSEEKEIEFRISWRGSKMVMSGEGGSVVLARSGGSADEDDIGNRNRDNYGMDRDYEDDSKGGSLVGRWRFVDFQSDEEELSEEEIRTMKSATVEFKRDGSFSSTSRQPDGETRKTYGTYTYDSRSGILKTVEDSGKEESLEVEFRGNNKVRLRVEGGTITMERD